MLTINKTVFSVSAYVIILIGAILVLLTSRSQSLTIDEPNHLYCGIEWLQHGKYSFWPENPPMSRLPAAVGPFLDGYRTEHHRHEAENVFLYFLQSYNFGYLSQGPIRDQLLKLRIFMVPFFFLAAFLFWRWTRDLVGDPVALIALALFVFLPPFLAHSSIATTDVPFAAASLLCFYVFVKWIQQPNWKFAVIFGLALGFSITTKFSTFVFFPVFAAVVLFFYLKDGISLSGMTVRQWLKNILVTAIPALITTIIFVWAVYGFTIGRLNDQPVIPLLVKEGAASATVANYVVPAPEFFAGILLLAAHHSNGALTYTNGEMYQTGIWYFYFLSFVLKTPLPLLIVTVAGMIAAIMLREKKYWQMRALAMIPLAFLCLSVISSINYGMRHFLIIYPFAAIGGIACLSVLAEKFHQQRMFRALGIGAAVLSMFLTLWNFPSYLSYFNAFAGSEPGKYLVDSDLDWGQGLFDLEKYMDKNNIDTVSLAYMGQFTSCWMPSMRVKALPPDEPVKGWVAVTETVYRGLFYSLSLPQEGCLFFQFAFDGSNGMKLHQKYRWLDAYPVKATFNGMRLYHVTEDNGEVPISSVK